MPTRQRRNGVRHLPSSSAQFVVPRQALTPTPYAVTAGTVTGVLPAGSLSGTYPGAVTLNNPANVFAGDENSRTDVQQFVGLLTRLAMAADGSVTLISHPSLTGINTGSGISGKWHNAVRARFYLTSIKPESGEQPDNDLREIIFKKNQYGPVSENIVLRWRDGLFLPVPGV